MEGVIKANRDRNTSIDHQKIKKWSIEILEGLDFLHGKQVVHFDIKPANILLEKLDRVKIGDLGLARSFLQIQVELIKEQIDFGFTPAYASPQIIKNENINEKTDIW